MTGLPGLVVLLITSAAAWHDSQHDVAPDWPDYLDSFRSSLHRPREEPGLVFPALSARQKQFALSPGHPDFYRQRPDFLQFRLQALDDSEGPLEERRREAGLLEHELEHELEAVLGRRGDDGGLADMKRAMVGGPRALPYTLGDQQEQADDALFTTIIALTSAGAVFAVLGVGYCYHRAAQVTKDGEETEYPAYGVTGPAKEASPAGDRKLAQSAQMYHYQHQKNQMIGLGRSGGAGGAASGGEESEAEGEEGEGDYTVYECPGLASTDEMEVKNPLFNDDPTPKNP